MDLRVYSVWEELLQAVGWELSPGKSYLLEHLAQVNSKTMRVRWLGQQVLFEEPIPFVNDGWRHQMGKSTCQIDAPPLEDMSLNWRKQYFGFERLPAKIRDHARRTMCENLENMASRLEKAKLTPFKIHIYNPVELGGFGIPGPFCKATALEALSCRQVKAERFLDKVVAEDKPETSPLWEPSKRFDGDLSDALLEQLDKCVAALTGLDLSSEVGLVDPDYRRTDPCDGEIHCRVYPSSFSLKAWSVGR